MNIIKCSVYNSLSVSYLVKMLRFVPNEKNGGEGETGKVDIPISNKLSDRVTEHGHIGIVHFIGFLICFWCN